MATKSPIVDTMPPAAQSGTITHEQSLAKYACTICAKRKVGCDKALPVCGNCVKYKVECRYEEPQPSQRHRKRKADVELIDRISQLEGLLRQHSIDPGPGVETSELTPQTKSEEKRLPIISARSSAKPPPFPSEKVAAEDASTGSRAKVPKFSLGDPSCLKFITRGSPSPFDPLALPSILALPSSNLLGLHPEPRHIFRLWQIYAERTNVIIKILHSPSVQQRILDASWNLEACVPSFQALLFGMYLAAVSSMTTSECVAHFSEDRAVLINRYRAGAWQSLLAAGLFETRDLEVLQAFALFLCSDPKSDSFTTLSAIAVRIALKMGLDKENTSVPIFEQEMRIRLWWYICTHDVLALYFFVSRDSAITDSILTPNVRLPLNVNDAELHPNMTKPPIEHERATEMIYVLLRYEGATFGHRLRQKQKQTGAFHFPIDDLEELFEHKYLRHVDERIPLHAAGQAMARYAMAGARYRLAYFKLPGHEVSDDGIFEQAVSLLELDKACDDNNFAKQLLWHNNPADLDATIFVLSKLRQQKAGKSVNRAWAMIIHFWTEHIDAFLADGEVEREGFFASLADLTLEAWRERKKQLLELHGSATALEMTPLCIDQLRELRRTRSFELERNTQATAGDLLSYDTMTAELPSQGMDFDALTDMFSFGNDLMFDFGFWGDFTQMSGLPKQNADGLAFEEDQI